MRSHPIEALEERRLLAAVYPTNEEQYLLELTNRARANPAAEAARYGIDLNEGLAPGTISSVARQPLAMNLFLVDAAQLHTQWMLDNDTMSHTGAGGSSSGGRMSAAGYVFQPPGWTGNGSGENLAWRGTTGALPNATASVENLHRDLFVDEGVDGRGHRKNILGASFKEAGTGVRSGTFRNNGTDYNSWMATEDFAYVNPGAFITGVAYSDVVAGDAFYTPGEGLGGVTVTATRASDGAAFTTTTTPSGGYALAVPAGTYSVRASGGAMASSLTFGNVAMSSQNRKRDFVVPAPSNDVRPPVAAAVSARRVSAASSASYRFTVTWSDLRGVKSSTIGNSDVHITAPNGTRYIARLVGKSPASGDVNTIVATYRITPPPGGAWDASDNGSYRISVRAGQVSDKAGNFMAQASIGTFRVSVPTGQSTAPAPRPLFSIVPVMPVARDVPGDNPAADSAGDVLS